MNDFEELFHENLKLEADLTAARAELADIKARYESLNGIRENLHIKHTALQAQLADLQRSNGERDAGEEVDDGWFINLREACKVLSSLRKKCEPHPKNDQ